MALKPHFKSTLVFFIIFSLSIILILIPFFLFLLHQRLKTSDALLLLFNLYPQSQNSTPAKGRNRVPAPVCRALYI